MGNNRKLKLCLIPAVFEELSVNQVLTLDGRTGIASKEGSRFNRRFTEAAFGAPKIRGITAQEENVSPKC